MHPASSLPDPEQEDWDAVVVGTGMGGSTVGYELARRGRRVLFLEKGKFLHSAPESRSDSAPGADPMVEARLAQGQWPLPLQGRTGSREVTFNAPWGCGTGGSTTIYGAQLERFTAADFTPRSNFPDVKDANLPERWPISYDELVPYYRVAESLYRVRGTQDPLNPDPRAALRPPPHLSARDDMFRESFRELGLHPYQSHVGFDYRLNCRECMNFCSRGCKSDAASICLMPALTYHGAHILAECEVLELRADRTRVTALVARWQGRQIRLTARVVVLAAGALMTPTLLLKSSPPTGAVGLANGSGQVGRNLMLHTSDFVAVDPKALHSVDGPARALALNDFYLGEDGKLGTLQSLGIHDLSPAVILSYLKYLAMKDPRWWRTLSGPLNPLVAHLAPKVLRRAGIFTTIVEDLPYAFNRVVPDSRATNGLRFEFTYTRELRERNRRFRRALTQRLSARHRVTFITGGSNNTNVGHVCGTCRFGDNPGTSVLDASNRAHHLDNLYVVDASFFPSSGGTNPSLTVAANALRVAKILDERLP
jgi:choline dehydrogenase-like flavoprotein